MSGRTDGQSPAARQSRPGAGRSRPGPARPARSRTAPLPAPPICAGPDGVEIALDLLITAAEAQAHQLAMQHHTVPPHLRPALRDELSELVDRAAPRLGPARLPTAQSEPAPHR